MLESMVDPTPPILNPGRDRLISDEA